MADKPERDEHSGMETTGHEWDGIKELNTPLPRWWLWTFYLTIIWGIGYVIAYPAWPMISGATPGVLGYSSRMDVKEDIAMAREAWSGLDQRIAAMELEEIQADQELATYAQAGGAAVFKTFCAQCHGAGAAGAMGYYPNLLDDDWIWGGDVEAIYQTIAHGVRWEEDDDTRLSQMPAFGDDELLTEEEIAAVTEYVRSLSGLENAATEEGATLFAENCAAGHGDEGLGVTELGAPNLADTIWLYGGEREAIVATITHSRGGIMPAWANRLSETQIKQVAIYVHELGGGE
jgi:cytochrome c oxidase cbb3-type subunit 3